MLTTACRVALAVVALPFTCSAAAAPIAYDGMNYPDPPTAAGSGLDGLAGGTGWTAAWDANNDGFKTNPGAGLSYGSLVTLTGQVQELGGTSPNNEAYYRQTSASDLTTITGSANRWFSLLLDADAPTPPASAGQRLLWAGLSDSGSNATSLSSNLGFSILSTATGYEMSARYRTTESATPRIALDLTDATILIVGKYSYNSAGNDFMEVWLNPAGSTLGGADLNSSSSADGYAAITNTNDGQNRGASAFAINATGGIGNTFTGIFDEVRVGDTFADVTPVPEPASLALLAAGGLLLCGRRRGV